MKMDRKRLLLWAGVAAGWSVCYLFGAYSLAAGIWPMPQIQELRLALNGTLAASRAREATLPVRFDDHGFLLRYPGKQEVACPKQTPRTLVLLAIGQSNAANSGGQRFRSAAGSKILNYSDERCFVAASPLLGSEGEGGEIWTPVANRLIAAGAFDQVIIVPMGASGSHILRWAHGDLNAKLRTRLASLATRYRITHIVWVQGEADAERNTGRAEYAARLMTVISTARSNAPDAALFINVGTRCTGNHSWLDGNPTQQALRAAPDPGKHIYPGADTDQIIEDIDRNSACHWGASGQNKVADALAQAISRTERAGALNLGSLR